MGYYVLPSHIDQPIESTINPQVRTGPGAVGINYCINSHALLLHACL
jgi:hypothetical protein